MTRSRLSLIAGSVFLLLGLVGPALHQASACAALSPEAAPSPETFVTSENAVIIWDEAHQIEHFIRQASMITQGSDLGFLVPTPQTPELAQVSDQIFDLAAFLGGPERISPTDRHSPLSLLSPFLVSSQIHLNRLNLATFLSGFNEPGAMPTRSAIVSSQEIAGYHATILAAEDEPSLAAWLAANGYLSTPELRAWLKPYIVQKWKITAFKLNKTDGAPLLTTPPIRLSFHTDRPFYPYSEPSDRQLLSAASPRGRALRVSILSNERMTGTLAHQQPWPSQLEFVGSSDPVSAAPSESKRRWLAFAGLDDVRHETRLPPKLTTFIDESNPRPGTSDLYFYPDPDQDSFRGKAVDFTLPTRHQLVFDHPFVDVAVLLTLIVLPLAPLYCGWKVINQRIEKERISPRALWARQTYLGSPAAIPQKWPIRMGNGLVGLLAVGLGAYYGMQFLWLLLDGIASVFLGWSETSGSWVWSFSGLLLIEIAIVAMSWGVIFCGVKLVRASMGGIPLSSQELSFDEALRQGSMGGLSFLAGLMAVVVVESVVVSML